MGRRERRELQRRMKAEEAKRKKRVKSGENKDENLMSVKLRPWIIMFWVGIGLVVLGAASWAMFR